MDSNDDPFERAAARISDGLSVDWGDIERSGRLDEGRIHALRVLARLQAASASPPLETGYDVHEEIGHGAVGRVYRATDRALGRDVALKILEPDSFASDHVRSRFVQEARVLAALDHPNIVRIHSIDELDGRIRLCLELVQGRTLERIVRDDGPLAPEEAARIGVELCRAAAAIHAQGLLHRDLKPANVMRETGGRVVVLDFGIARSPPSSAGAEAGPYAGTPRYMAPEQFEGRQDIGPAADLFAIGEMLYFLVSGAHPFAGTSWTELRDHVLRGLSVPLLDRRPDAPAEFASIVSRALSVKPVDRFASAGEMEEALRAFLAGPAAAQTSSRARRQLTRTVWLAAGAIVIVIALALVALDSGHAQLDLETRFFVLRDGRETALAAGDSVHVGDRLMLEARVSRAAHVYVFDADDTGALFCLFPLQGYELENPLRAGSTQRLPGRREGEERFWEVTQAGGTETLLVVASADPIEEAEALRKKLAPVVDRMAPAAIAVRTDARSALLRGMGATVPASGLAPTANDMTSSRAVDAAISSLERTAARDRAVRVIRLRGGS